MEASSAGRAGPTCVQHACLTFGEADEMLDLTAAYIRDGLSAGMKPSTPGLCQYDRDKFDPITLASAARLHARCLTPVTYHAGGTGRICRQYAPPGLVLAGEIDYQAEQPLARALAEAVRLDGEMMINMSGLRFLDARCARLIADAARTIAASSSRQVTLRCLPEVATRSFQPALALAGRVRLETCGSQ